MQRSKQNRIDLVIVIIVFFISLLYMGNTEINFYGNNVISDNTLDSIFQEYGIKIGIDKILKLYNNNGFPFTKIGIDSVIKIGDKDMVYIDINEGKIYKIGDIKNKGILSDYYINKICNLNGNIFSVDLIAKQMNLLEKESFIEYNDNYTIYKSSDSTVNIITNINQKKSSTISGVLASDFDTVLFSGFLKIDLISPQGYGRKFFIDYEKPSNMLSNMHVNIALPYIFTLPLGIELYGGYSNIDSSITVSNVNSDIFFKRNNFTIYTGLGKNWNLFVFHHDSNSTYFNYRIKLEYSDISSSYHSSYKLFSSEYPYSFVDIGLNKNCNIKNFIIDYSFSIHYLYNYGDSIYKYMQIPLGGTKSIKGYSENFLFVKDKFENHLEFYYHFSDNFDFGVFGDMGFYDNNDIKNIFKDYIYSSGPLFFLKNSNMALSIYYAVNSTIFYNGRLHLQINYFF